MKNENWPGVTVIVPTYEQEDTLNPCIESILAQDYQGDMRLIVVDNSPVFGLEERKKSYPDVTFLWEPAPGSYSARNKALEHTDTPILAFTDSDCRVHPAWLTSAVTAIKNNPGAGLIGGNISVVAVNPEKPTTAEFYEMLFAFPQETFVEKDHFAATANMITRREIMDIVGGFNGKLKSRGDMEWGQRTYAAGFKGHYDANVIVYHPTRIDSQIKKKIRRVVAGARDREPGWKPCLIYMYRFLRPPRQKVMAILKFQDPRLSLPGKLKLAGYCVFLTWYESFYRLKLELFKTESPR